MSLSRCKVIDIDWAPTAMPTSVAAGYADRLRAGEPMVLRGALVRGPEDAASKLVVREIWIGNTTERVEGVFTLVTFNGTHCPSAPCPDLTERRLNSNLSAELVGIDLDDTDADAEAQERALSKIRGDGLIVVGYRRYDGDGNKLRAANKFYTRAPVPLR